MVTRFTDLIVQRASSVVNIGLGVSRTGPKAGEIGGIVVEVGVGAGLEGEEKHLDDNLVHGIVLTIVLADEADVRRLDVEVPGVRHCQVELREPEEHSAAAVIFYIVGDCLQAHTGGCQDHCFELHYCFVVVLVDCWVYEDRGGAYEFDKVIVLHCYVVVDVITSVEEGLDFDEIVDSYCVGELEAGDGGHGPEVGQIGVPVCG